MTVTWTMSPTARGPVFPLQDVDAFDGTEEKYSTQTSFAVMFRPGKLRLATKFAMFFGEASHIDEPYPEPAAGGVPLKMGNEVVGAVGVSGGMAKQDQAVGEAGVRVFEGIAKRHVA